MLDVRYIFVSVLPLSESFEAWASSLQDEYSADFRVGSVFVLYTKLACVHIPNGTVSSKMIRNLFALSIFLVGDRNPT